jgi:hypothetical protein
MASSPYKQIMSSDDIPYVNRLFLVMASSCKQILSSDDTLPL